MCLLAMWHRLRSRRAAVCSVFVESCVPVLRPDGAVPWAGILVEDCARPSTAWIAATGLARCCGPCAIVPITELQRQAAERGLVDGDAMASRNWLARSNP